MQKRARTWTIDEFRTVLEIEEFYFVWLMPNRGVELRTKMDVFINAWNFFFIVYVNSWINRWMIGEIADRDHNSVER